MDDKNLGHLCLEAHSHKANKRHIIEQLRPALTGAENKRSVSFDDAASDERREAQSDLNALVHALHRPRAPLNLL